MGLVGRRTLRYTIWTIAPMAALATALAAALAMSGVWIAALLSMPWLAWRYDNDSGNFFVLAMLLLLVLGIVAMLLFLIAVTH
jgi:hypothetical protein